MILGVLITLLLSLFPLTAWSQGSEDNWTAPTSPDRSTNLQSGTPFTLRWKSSLQIWSKILCSSCDATKLDLWVTSYHDSDYKYKIASSIDITATYFYQWDVNIPSSALSANNLWVLSFTPYRSSPPFDQQIPSPAFLISGPSQPSPISNATTTPSQSSSTTSPSPTVSTPTSLPPSPTPTPPPPQQYRTTKKKLWIAGVVVGPMIGLALGAGLAWFLLRRKAKEKSVQSDEQGVAYVPYVESKPMDEGQEGQVAGQKVQYWRRYEEREGGRYEPVEMSGTVTPPEPVELWGGNYKRN